MTYALRDASRSQASSRLAEIKAAENSDEGYPGNKSVGPAAFKRGGVVTGAKAAREMDEMEKSAKRRPDRPHRASGGAVKGKGTNVNIIIQPQGGADKSPMPMPIPVPAGPPMGAAPMGPPPGPQIPPEALAALAAQGGPGGPPPGMPMRKRGGAVKMEAGAGSGAGRLEKTADAKRGK